MLFNSNTGKYLAGYSFYARNPLIRLTGMICRRFVCGKFDALIFEKCNAVHTCFMRYPLDLVFIDRENRVVSVHRRVRPWKFVFGGKGAVTVIELPPGAVDFSGTEKEHIIEFRSTSADKGIEKISSGAILLSDSNYGNREI